MVAGMRVLERILYGRDGIMWIDLRMDCGGDDGWVDLGIGKDGGNDGRRKVCENVWRLLNGMNEGRRVWIGGACASVSDGDAWRLAGRKGEGGMGEGEEGREGCEGFCVCKNDFVFSVALGVLIK